MECGNPAAVKNKAKLLLMLLLQWIISIFLLLLLRIYCVELIGRKIDFFFFYFSFQVSDNGSAERNFIERTTKCKYTFWCM